MDLKPFRSLYAFANSCARSYYRSVTLNIEKLNDRPCSSQSQYFADNTRSQLRGNNVVFDPVIVAVVHRRGCFQLAQHHLKSLDPLTSHR